MRANLLLDGARGVGSRNHLHSPQLLVCQGVEASLFATLMSILNAGTFVGQATGSLMTRLAGVSNTDFQHLPGLVVAVTLCGLGPLPLLRLISSADSSVSEALPLTGGSKRGR